MLAVGPELAHETVDRDRLAAGEDDGVVAFQCGDADAANAGDGLAEEGVGHGGAQVRRQGIGLREHGHRREPAAAVIQRPGSRGRKAEAGDQRIEHQLIGAMNHHSAAVHWRMIRSWAWRPRKRALSASVKRRSS